MADALTTEELPTLLVVGVGEPMWEAIEAGLERHATFAEAARKESAAQAAMVAAPDVILLVGDAAKTHDEVLAAFAKHPIARVVPVIVLIDRADLKARLDMSRRGVTFVERSASSDQVAREIAALCRELPDRPSKPAMELGETSLDEVMEILKAELQSGILSVKTGHDEGARFVLRSGRQVGSAIQDFVSRIRPLVEQADGPVRFDFESADSREVPLLDDLDDAADGDLAIFRDRRIVLIEDDSAAADTLAQELRAHGATVVVVTSSGSGLPRARSSDPEIVLVEEHGLDGPTYEVMQTLRRDPRLKWASLLVIRRDELIPLGEPPRMERLAKAFGPLLEADEEIARQARELDSFDTRLEAVGPSRLLRALASADRTLRATIRHPRTIIEVSFAEGLVAGAEARQPGQSKEESVGGPKALAALLAISSGRVRVEARAAPATANLLAPPSSAMAAAAAETPPIKPSLPPPPLAPARPSQPPAQLLAQLEQVLGDLEAAGVIESIRPPADGDEDAPTRTVERLKPASTDVGPGFVVPRPGAVPKAVPPPKPAEIPKPARPVRPPGELAKGLVPERAKAPPKPVSPPKPAAAAKGAPRPAAPKGAPPKPAAAAMAPQPSPTEAEPPEPAKGPPRTVRKRTLVGMAAPVMPSGRAEPTADASEGSSEAVPPPSASAAAVPAPAVPPLSDAAEPPAPKAAVPPPPEAAGPPAPEAAVPPPPPFDESSAAVPPPVAAPPQPPQPPPESMPGAAPAPIPAAAPVAAVPPAEPSGTETTDATMVYGAASQRRWWIWVVAAVALFAVSAAAAFYLGGDEPPEVALNAEPATSTATDGDGPAATRANAEADGDDGDEGGDPAEAVEENEEPQTAEAPEETDEPETLPAETADGDEETAPDGEEPTEDDDLTDDEEMTDEEREALGEDGDRPMTRRERLDAHINAGNFFRGRRRYNISERRYLAALRMSGTNGRALTGISLLKIAKREPNEAVRYARRLVRVRPGSAGARVILGDALALDGDRTGARREYRKALDINPRHRGARRRLGR